MSRSRPALLKAVLLVTLAALAGLPAAFGLKVREETGRFDAIAIPDPAVAVAPETLSADAPGLPMALAGGWSSFKALNGGAWDVYLDARSGAPQLVQGQGVPFIPGSGNTLQASAPVTLESLAGLLRGFAAKNAALLMADDKELVLNEAGSAQITPDLWKVVFDRVVGGVPVSGDRYVFYVGHGNLIAFGAPRWSAITADASPTLGAAEARGVLTTYMGIKGSDPVEVLEPGALTFVPMTADGTAPDSFSGAVGTGYRTALAWRIRLQVAGEPGIWAGLVDAHTGTVLALYDDIMYAQAKGGTFPISDDGICPDGCEQAGFPMPFADITVGTSASTAASMGWFSCLPGGSTATTTLAGKYVKVNDTCGAISVATTCDSDLDLKTSTGTDCTVPAGTSAGDTHAARSSFYHLNRIKEHARAWLPSNTWLTQQLGDNVNINQVCNAYWDGGSVNFYRSGGGCRNTGEISGVFLHEWGHGLDQNDGGGFDNPSEAYADITSFLLTHKSCIGRGFTSGNPGNCSGYGDTCLSCTGVRDQDWNKLSGHTPRTPSNWPAYCSSGSGPCSKEVHCEAYLSGETIWDLAVRDLTAAGIDQQTAWQITDRLWYKSRNGSGGNAYGCGATASTRSCGAGTWFTELRTVDDDDGNLANGTPHAAAIFSAFNRHAIPCGASTDATNLSTTACPTLAAPTVTTNPSPNTVALSWTAVAGASSYNVLRNDQGCGWGYTLIASVAGTTYTDTKLPNAFSLYYAIQPVGSNTACTGTLSACTSVQAGGSHAIYNSTAYVGDTCDSGGAGNADGYYDPGERIQFSVSIKNDGAMTLTGVTATLVPTTAGVTMVNGTASYPDLVGGATGTSLAPHYTALLPTNLACGSTVRYTLTINSNQGSWTGTVTQTVAHPYPQSGKILNESFASGIPAGWTIVDGGSGGGAAATWNTSNPGSRTATSPIAAPFVIVDSNWAGAGATQDEELITPILDLSVTNSVTLVYDEYFQHYATEIGDVDVRSSLTGGAWVNVLRNQGADTSNPTHRAIIISTQAAGASDVQVRFHYYGASNDNYWQVDNVVVSWTRPAYCAINVCNPLADLSVTNVGSPASVATAQNITYTVTVTNNGPGAAASPVLTEAVPSGATFQSLSSPAGWSCSKPAVGGTGTINCTATTLASGGSAVFTIVDKVNWCAGNGTLIGSTATVSSGVSDPNGANNSAAASTGVTDSGSCDDGNACTGPDTCTAGVCGGALLGAPPETGNSLMVGKSAGVATISWTEPAGTYNIYRGSRTTAAWSYNQTCLAKAIPGPVQDAAAPAPGTTFFYLLARQSACGESILGRNSVGAAIPNSNPCP